MISQCPTCLRSLQVPDSAVGKKVRCTGCQAVFVVEDEPIVVTVEPEPATYSAAVTMEASSPLLSTTLASTPVPAPPTVANPFALDAAALDHAASLDFGRDEAKLNTGLRIRIERAGRMMMSGAALSFVVAIMMVILALFFMQSSWEFVVRVIAAVLVYGLSIMIILCARSLFILRSRGLGIASAIMCLIISVPGLSTVVLPFLTIIGAFLSDRGGRPDMDRYKGLMCFGSILALVALCQVIYCLWGGISTLLFIFRPDVSEVIRETQEREARVAETSSGFVSDGCIRAAIWQGIMSLVMFLNIIVRIAIYWRLSTLVVHNDALFIEVCVAVGLMTIFMFLNLAAFGSLLLKRLFVIPIIGGVASLLVALFSFCSAFVSVPGMLLVQDFTLQAILCVHALLMLVNNVIGIGGFITAFDAARLIRKFGSVNTNAD